MAENKLTEIRDGKYVIPLRQDGKGKWLLARESLDPRATQFLYGECADKLAAYENIGTPDEIRRAAEGTMKPSDAETDCQMTNQEYIQSMSREELAMNMMCPNESGLAEIICDRSDSCNCYECILDRLRQKRVTGHENYAGKS